MKFARIKENIYEIIKDRFELQNNPGYENELLEIDDENVKNKGILRIKRKNTAVEKWKTLVLVEIEALNESEMKQDLKKAINWLASVKEILLGTENSDLYLFLAFSHDQCIEECLRIESTEQFCRKYVLLPGEDIADFLNRTFLQKVLSERDTATIEDPLERAFFETAAKHSWLTPEIQTKWKKAFSELSGSELADVVLAEGDPI